MVISDLWHGDLLEKVLRAEMVKKISSVLIILTYIKISPEIYCGSRMCFNQLINCEREFGEFIDKILPDPEPCRETSLHSQECFEP